MRVYSKYETTELKSAELSELDQMVLGYMMDSLKYRTMWALRSIENEIDQEGGVIIVNEDGQITTDGFSDRLLDKIEKLLMEADKI